MFEFFIFVYHKIRRDYVTSMECKYYIIGRICRSAISNIGNDLS